MLPFLFSCTSGSSCHDVVLCHVSRARLKPSLAPLSPFRKNVRAFSVFLFFFLLFRPLFLVSPDREQRRQRFERPGGWDAEGREPKFSTSVLSAVPPPELAPSAAAVVEDEDDGDDGWVSEGEGDAGEGDWKDESDWDAAVRDEEEQTASGGGEEQRPPEFVGGGGGGSEFYAAPQALRSWSSGGVWAGEGGGREEGVVAAEVREAEGYGHPVHGQQQEEEETDSDYGGQLASVEEGDEDAASSDYESEGEARQQRQHSGGGAHLPQRGIAASQGQSIYSPPSVSKGHGGEERPLTADEFIVKR